YAATLGQILTGLKCQVDVASTTNEAVAFIHEKRFDIILLDVQWLASRIPAMLQELYNDVSRHLDSPRVRLMSNFSASSLLTEVQRSGALETIPATTRGILSLVRSTAESKGLLVAGTASTEWIQALLEEGYPAVVVHSLDDAIRHLLHSTHFVFLETGETVLAGSDRFVVLQELAAESLAGLAATQKDSYLQYLKKPQAIEEITEVLADLHKELSDAELRMSAGRA
ncbi:MAG TPA: hypothetical protein VFO86_16805, partial [Terriglobia bacterium]|nr:hypothetical protein [Terriglobia bacterium]